jgi:anaerobic carbon-monoxide dehydrogenase iron sulfur subunit
MHRLRLLPAGLLKPGRAGGYSPRLARLKVLSENENLVNRPLVCTAVRKPFLHALLSLRRHQQMQKTGVVLIDKETCTGCGNCVSACPDKMIQLDAVVNRADKCDLCGADPLCVKYCVPESP